MRSDFLTTVLFPFQYDAWDGKKEKENIEKSYVRTEIRHYC